MIPIAFSHHRLLTRDGHEQRACASVHESQRRVEETRGQLRRRAGARPYRHALHVLLALSLSTSVGAQNRQGPRGLDERRVALKPLLTIGDESDDAKRFDRIVGVTRLPGGEVVVLDGASQELRVYASNGDFMRRIGRRGAGPGELENATALWRVRDSLFVAEQPPAQSRVNVYDVREGFKGRLLLRARNAARGVGAVARLANGALLVVPAGFRPFVPPPYGRAVRDTTAVGLLQVGDPGEVRWMGEWPSASWLSYALSSGPVRTGVARYSLGPVLVLGSSADRVWIGDSGDGVIKRYDGAGTFVGVARMPTDRRPFTDSILARLKVEALGEASTSDERARIEAEFEIGLRTRLAPAFARFVPGPDGEMWVMAFNEDPNSRTQAVVFDVGGTAMATAVVPARVRVFEVGRDYLAGVHTSNEGVESVVVYALGSKVR